MNKQKEAFRNRLLSEIREELVRVETKTTALFSMVGIVATILISVLIFKETLNTYPFWGKILLLATVLMLLISIIFSIVSLYPKTKSKTISSQINYYGDIAKMSKTNFEIALKQSDPNARVKHQIFVLSEIIDKKYKNLKIGLWAFSASLFFCFGSLVFSFWDFSS